MPRPTASVAMMVALLCVLMATRLHAQAHLEPTGDPPDVDAATDFLRGFSAGPCTYLRSPYLSRRSMRIDAFGAELEPFQRLDAEFKRRFNVEADIYLATISPEQCPVIDAAEQLRWGSLPEQLISPSREATRSGSVFAVRFAGDRAPELFQVGRSGRVTASVLDIDQVTKTIHARVSSAVTPRDRLLLLAISSENPELRETLHRLAAAPGGASATDFGQRMKDGRAIGSLHPVRPSSSP